jgi:hypothetical protein
MITDSAVTGLQLRIAEGDDLPSLVTAATAFLRNHVRELHRLMDSRGFDGMVIDFGLTFDRNIAARVFQILSFETSNGLSSSHGSCF